MASLKTIFFEHKFECGQQDTFPISSEFQDGSTLSKLVHLARSTPPSLIFDPLTAFDMPKSDNVLSSPLYWI